jgi:hypothetical protein
MLTLSTRSAISRRSPPSHTCLRAIFLISLLVSIVSLAFNPLDQAWWLKKSILQRCAALTYLCPLTLSLPLLWRATKARTNLLFSQSWRPHLTSSIRPNHHAILIHASRRLSKNCQYHLQQQSASSSMTKSSRSPLLRSKTCLRVGHCSNPSSRSWPTTCLMSSTRPRRKCLSLQHQRLNMGWRSSLGLVMRSCSSFRH